jgi:hypothetical protein
MVGFEVFDKNTREYVPANLFVVLNKKQFKSENSPIGTVFCVPALEKDTVIFQTRT